MGGELEGKVAVVTRAGDGIGRASAVAFAAEGASVAVVDARPSLGEATVAQVTSSGAAAVFVHAPTDAPDDVARAIAQAVGAFGRLDFAHNNGGHTGDPAAIGVGSVESWNDVLTANLTSIWLYMRAELPHLLAAGGGAIVNTSSVAGLVGIPGLGAYVASKHGVVGLSRTAALDYAANAIRVNAICPGTTLTPALEDALAANPSLRDDLVAPIPARRIAQPQEIAALAVWLCTDAASSLTGTAIPIDGAVTAQ